MFKLPQLEYAFDALEPYIDAKTMEIHYTKHHQKYVDDLNLAISKYPDLQDKSLNYLLENLEILPKEIKTAVNNNAGGDFNHSFFWPSLKKDINFKPDSKLIKEINKKFNSFEDFKEKFNNAAKTRFGSGWAWLVLNKAGDLEIISTANQDCPISQKLTPILGLDVWEHAYYLKYQNRRVDYIDAWWHVINWDFIESNYNKI